MTAEAVALHRRREVTIGLRLELAMWPVASS
jgi:hypothetical protein